MYNPLATSVFLNSSYINNADLLNWTELRSTDPEAINGSLNMLFPKTSAFFGGFIFLLHFGPDEKMNNYYNMVTLN